MKIRNLLFCFLAMIMIPCSLQARYFHHHHHNSWGLPIGVAVGSLIATATYNSVYNYPYRYQSYYTYNYPNPVIYRNSNVIVYEQPIQRETIVIDPYTGNQTKYITIYR